MKRNSYKVFAFSIILSLIFTALPAPYHVQAAGPTVFINEIHYDNTGADAGEAIEVAGPAGTDLAGWNLVLYNGNGGAFYDTIALSGIILDQQNGFGTLSFDTVGIQNGSPDGLALVDATSSVVQFLSYEGSFAAIDGPASGMTSVDIIVSEASTSAVGDSLQLMGTGTAYSDFTWAGSSLSTFGAVNTNQTFSSTTNPSGLGTADPASVDPAGSSLLTVAVTPGANPTSTGLTVTCDLALIGGSTSQSFFDDGTSGDVSSSDNTFSYLATVDIGTSPGAKSLPCTINDSQLRTGSANVDLTVNSSVEPSDIIINEVDSDTPGTDAAEFVELYDGGVGNTALDGMVVVLFNGSDVKSYMPAFDLDGYTTDANGYFVIGTVENADIYADPGSSGWLQNGADAVALYSGDAIDFPNDTPISTENLLDAIVYDTSDGDIAGLLALLNSGQPQVDESGGGDKDNQSNQRCPNGSGGARNTDTYAQFAPTPGDENICVTPVAEFYIHDVQGNGAASPKVGQTVAIEGIVVGDFQDGISGTNGDFNGFHVQEEDADVDIYPITSEGIFVFDGYTPAVDVHIGDLVRVEGAVSEYNGLTEITSFTGVTILSSGNELPTAASLSLPVTNLEDFEAYEGMLVTFPQALVISEYFNYDRFGEIVLTSERHLTPSAEFDPGSAAIAAAQAFLLDKITLDDGRSTQNPDPAIHPNGGVFDLTNLFRGGDTVANVTGIMDYSFGLYRIQPTQGADYTNANPRTAEPDDVGGNLKVASFNVLNYFSTLDNSGPICGPLANQDCRGADDAGEFTRQRDKIIAAISVIDADVVGLLEIENNVNDDAVIDLVNGLNAVNGAGTYDYVSTGTIGTDAIKLALIYKPASVSLVGSYAILDSSVDTRFLDTKNRPVLAQTFMDSATGGIFTIAVNHLKSKGSACDDVGDPDTGDGAGNCNVTRTQAAMALVDWLATDPTGSDDADFLIIGDLNSYDKENPIDAIVAAGYTDLIYQFQGEAAYSYVFDGQLGYLDYALASANLASQVTGVTDWHINADEPDLIDYDTSYKLPAQDDLYEDNAFRSSDHDPVIIGLNVCDEIAPKFEKVSVTPDVLWPANHKYVDVTATVVVSDNFDTDPTVTLVSVTSNEPDNGDDDGNTVDDIVIVDDFTFKLRAERSGIGTGRIYTITYRVTDACGNSTTMLVTVSVPLSMRKR